MPRASVRTATAVKPGFFTSMRRPNFVSWNKVLILNLISGHRAIGPSGHLAISSSADRTIEDRNPKFETRNWKLEGWLASFDFRVSSSVWKHPITQSLNHQIPKWLDG